MPRNGRIVVAWERQLRRCRRRTTRKARATNDHDDRVDTKGCASGTPGTRPSRSREPALRERARALYPPPPRPARHPRRGGSRAHRAQRRRDPSRYRHGVSRRPRDPRDLPRRGRRRGRRARAIRAGDVPPDHPGEHAARVRPARTQSREHRPARRRPHRALSVMGSAVRARPRRRPALRDHRRLPPARADPPLDPVPAPLRRHRVRAGRHSRQQAPPRHALPPHSLLRSPLHGCVHRRGTGAGCGGHGEDRIRRRTSCETTPASTQ